MNTYLEPIEKPKGMMMKLAYYFTRRQLGRVITPTKVFAARLPLAFGLFSAKIAKLDKKLTLPHSLTLLIREQVARINVCLFCMDITRWVAMKTTGSDAKLDELENYLSSPLFTEAERTALDFATMLTSEKKMTPEMFERLKQYYTEREICEIIWLVASEHVYNITNIGLNIHSDMFCQVKPLKKAS